MNRACQACNGKSQVKEIRTLYPSEWGVLYPAGLSYSLDRDHLALLSKSPSSASTADDATIVVITPIEDFIGTATLAFVADNPINIAYSDTSDHLFLLNNKQAELAQVSIDQFGVPDPENLSQFDITHLGLENAEGLSVDLASSRLIILDSGTSEIVSADLNNALNLVSKLDLSPLGATRLSGVAVHPANHNLFVISPIDNILFELTQSGQLVNEYDLSVLNLSDPRGLAFGPSADQTDDPTTMHLFIADSNLPDERPETHESHKLFLPILHSNVNIMVESRFSSSSAEAGQVFGRILEVELQPPPKEPAVAPSNTETPIETPGTSPVNIIQVPGDAQTIQAGIDLANDGDLVLVAPGLYQENIQISGKTITLASQFHTTGDFNFIDETIIDGGGGNVITVASTVGPETKIVGFTIRNGDDGIRPEAKLHIRNNYFTGNRDAIDYEGGGGLCSNNVFENNKDDAIDLDGPTEVTIEDNLIRQSGDDGIEIRLHPYNGSTLNIIIRRNEISTSDEDGIQIIDYLGLSDRAIFIERNVIKDSRKVGVGLMDNGDTKEDFRGASIPEPIKVFNNTFIRNDHGLTGGDNLVALNNIFLGSPTIALKNVDGNSIAAYNLFWQNGVNYQNSHVDTSHSTTADPRLDANDRLMPNSPAIDTGIAFFTWNSEIVLDLPPNEYSGAAPDLGAYETHSMTDILYLPVVLSRGIRMDALQ